MSLEAQGSEAVEQIAGSSDRLFLSCEHASQAFPLHFVMPEEDGWLLGTHWAFDLGAADLTREMAKVTGAPAVLSRFSRLLVDPNRPIDSGTLFRDTAESKSIALNSNLSDEEKEERLSLLYRPYHAAYDEALTASAAQVVLAVHSFTPVYEGETRSVEIGVLFGPEEALAVKLADEYRHEGFEVRLNEPYSGAQGMMYAADWQAAKHDRRALEIEVRQDLCVEPAVRRRVSEATARFVMKLNAAAD